MSNTATVQGMLYRTLGSTGEKVSAIGIGGWHIALNGVDEQLSIRIIRTAVDRGINFMDNCWDYNEGTREIRMGKALRPVYVSPLPHTQDLLVLWLISKQAFCLLQVDMEEAAFTWKMH